MDAFIDDGYTEVVGIEAVDGLHPAMEFTRRPFAGDEVQEEFRKVQLGPTALHRDPKKRKADKIKKEQSPEGIRSRLFDLLLSRASDWSFPDSTGETPETLVLEATGRARCSSDSTTSFSDTTSPTTFSTTKATESKPTPRATRETLRRRPALKAGAGSSPPRLRTLPTVPVRRRDGTGEASEVRP